EGDIADKVVHAPANSCFAAALYWRGVEGQSGKSDVFKSTTGRPTRRAVTVKNRSRETTP
ncbi:MAG: hypothetical protein ABWY10_14920, partial [Tardiphaga sp.]